MRVGWIAYGLDRPLGGIGSYSQHLITALAGLRPHVEALLLGCATQSSQLRIPESGRAWLWQRAPALLTVGSLVVPLVAARQLLDVVHDPSGLCPFPFGAGPSCTVVTVHDVFAWSLPGHSTMMDSLVYRHWLPRVLRHVDAVITVSEASAADIRRHLHVRPERIHVVYEGVGSQYRPAARRDTEGIRTRLGLPDRFLLYLGSVEARKNLVRLMQACAILWRQGETRPLVIAGPRRWKFQSTLRAVEELGVADRVLFTGYVPDDDLPALYSAADLFVFPSLYEGFGLPPLEAMACGTPVVCSTGGSLPEVVGDAAVTVGPYDVEGLAAAMSRVLADPDLQDELRLRGLARAASFTWEKAARETVAVYESVLARRGG